MRGVRWGTVLVALTALAFRLDEPPPEPVALEARAEDTAEPLVRPPETALLTPAPGAPLVVAPGASFWIDMVLRIPLTPPPGVQQERALNDFGAEATGYADVGPRPLVPLPVTKIRPGGQSTHYRAVVEVPGWMPEGVWDLHVAGRGFEHAAPRALVVRRGPLGVVTLTAAELLAPGRARAAALSGATVALVPGGLAEASPPDERHTAFLAALEGVGLATVVRPSPADQGDGARSFRLRIAPTRVRGPAIDDGRWTEPAAARAVSIADVALEEGALVNRGAAAAQATLRVSSTGPSHLEVDGRRVEPVAVDLAGTLDKPTVLRQYRVSVPAAGRRRVALVPGPAPAGAAPLALVVPPRVDVADAVTLRPRDQSPRPASWAWSFGDETFAAGERVRHRFLRLGRHDVLLVRAGPDGAIARGTARLRVDTRVERGCSAPGGAPGASILPGAALLWLISGLARRGNPRRRPNVRSTTG